MHRNPLWIAILSVIGVVTVINTGLTAHALWKYARLNQQTTPQQIEWSILSVSDEQFIPYVRYQFVVKGEPYRGETQWHEAFLNEWAAKEAVTRLRQSSLQIWYNPSHPEFSTLEKIFPLKESLYTLFLWALFFYFAGLGWYIYNRKQH